MQHHTCIGVMRLRTGFDTAIAEVGVTTGLVAEFYEPYHDWMVYVYHARVAVR